MDVWVLTVKSLNDSIFFFFRGKEEGGRRGTSHKHTARLKTKDKDKILKAARERREHLFKRNQDTDVTSHQKPYKPETVEHL